MTAKFQSLKRILIEDAKGFMAPNKFRDTREMGPTNPKWNILSV